MIEEEDEDVAYLREIAKGLRDVGRMGSEVDKPEGSRYIQMSDTLANKIAGKLDEIAGFLKDAYSFEESINNGDY